jgi:hypothetical protein
MASCRATRLYIGCPRHAPGGQHRQGSIAPLAFSAPDPDLAMLTVVRGSPSSPMADHRHLAASRALAGQPFAILLGELHSSPERGITTITIGAKARPGVYPAKAHYSQPLPSLLSIRIQAEKESKACLYPIGRFSVTTPSQPMSPILSITSTLPTRNPTPPPMLGQ